MAHIRQKLHSRSGASVLLAMLLLLVAAMVSAVIISASVTAANRVRDDRDHQQKMLSVNSAARLVKKSLEAAQYIIVETKTETPIYRTETDDEGNEQQVFDHTDESFSYTYTPDPSDPSVDPSLSKELLIAIANAGAPATGAYYLIIDPKPVDSPVAGEPTYEKAIVKFTFSTGVSTDVDKKFSIKGAVYTMNNVPDGPDADYSGFTTDSYDNAYEAYIDQKGAAEVDFKGWLHYTKGVTVGSIGDSTVTTTTETWFFEKIDLFTVGESG